MNPIAANLDPDSGSRIVIQTLLVTDLVDSTQLVDRLGDDRAVDVFARHDRLARDLLGQHSGMEIDKTDGFLLLFDRPIDALCYALDYHRQLRKLGEQMGVELRARAGIHLGELVLRHNRTDDVARGAKPLEVEGLAKPTAARTMALASGGQTLLTQAAFDLCRRRLADLRIDELAVHWYNHGHFAFKGLEDAVGIYEVATVDVALPQPVQPNEKAHRATKEARGDHRRSTLFGAIGLLLLLAVASAWLSWRRPAVETHPGSEGQPRPAVAVLRFHMLSQNSDEAWLGTALAEMLSAHLGIDGSLRVIPAERILEAQRDLITTQEATSLGSTTLRSLRDRLGTDYVVSGSFSSGSGDGLDLNVYLQDTRLGDHSASLPMNGVQSELQKLVEETATRLRRQLGVATVSQQQALQLEAVISDDPEAREAYTRGLEKLRAYDAAGARTELQRAIAEDPSHALAHLALSQAQAALGYDELAQKSARDAYELLERKELPREHELSIDANYYEQFHDWDAAIETYRLLRDYHKDNIDHGLKLIDILLDADRSAEAVEILKSLQTRAAGTFADPRIDLAQAKIAREQGEWSLQLSAADRVLERARAQQARSLQAEAQLQRGWALLRLGRTAESRRALHEARVGYEAIGDRGQAARCIAELAVLDDRSGDLLGAEQHHQEALSIFRDIKDVENISRTLNNLAVLKRQQGQLAAALKLLEEAAELARGSGNTERLMWAQENTSTVLLRLGRLPEARLYAEEALQLAERSGNASGRIWALHDLGMADLTAGQLDQAETELRQGLSLASDSDSEHQEAYLYQALGRLLHLRDRLEEAEDAFEQALELRSQLEQSTNLAETQLLIGCLFLTLNRMPEAEALALQARPILDQQERADELALVDALLAQALAHQDRHEEANQALARARQLALGSESPQVRIYVEFTVVLNDYLNDDYSGLQQRFTELEQEARRFGLVVLEQDLLLAHAIVELSSGNINAGQARLNELIQGAHSEQFALNRRLATIYRDRLSSVAGAGSVVQPPPGREVIAP